MCIHFFELHGFCVGFFLVVMATNFDHAVAGGERKAINPELWYACAGPLVSLPPVGSYVVYFPQGHSEQVCCWIFFLVLGARRWKLLMAVQ